MAGPKETVGLLRTFKSNHLKCGGRAPGLGWSEGECVVTEGLREYFGQFGEVKECLVMRDPLTKRSR